MPAGSLDLLIEQGATFVKDLIWKDSNGVPVNVTGYTARMQVRPHKSSTTVIVEASTDNGYITMGTDDGAIGISIPAAITAAITQTRGTYDLEITDTEGVVTRLLEGGVEISKEVTR